MANAIWQATIVDQSGNVLPGAEVEVVDESTGLSAPLFTTRTGTTKSNPFFADANGFAQFYAAPGLYRITATSGGTGTTMTWRNVRLVDVATNSEAIAGTAGVLPDAAGVHSAIRGLAVGTVSQSGGAPTGAIIQRGSNANGEFVRYADGTQICWTTPRLTGNRNIANGNVFDSGLLGPYNWPVAFMAPPSVSGSTPSSEIGWMGALGTAALVYARSYNSDAIEISVDYVITGFGRWY